MITLVFIDLVNRTTMTQGTQAPLMNWKKPDKLWLGYVHLAVGGHIAKLAAEFEAEKAAA